MSRSVTADGKEVKDGDRVWLANSDGTVEDGIVMVIVSCEGGYQATCQTYVSKEAARLSAYKKKADAHAKWDERHK